MRVVITGATSGIGLALVNHYFNQGFDVYACGRNEDKLKALQQNKPGLKTLCFDVTDKQQTLKATRNIGNIDHLILNAGTCEYMDVFPNFDSSQFERIIQANLLSVGYCLEAFMPQLNPKAQIGLMSSSVTNLALPKAQAYGASKGGLDYLAKCLHLDLSPHQIGVSLIHPGFVKTPLTDRNKFNMPARVSSDYAAEKIFAGMMNRTSNIQFPTKFIITLKLLKLLPFFLWKKMILKGES